ncbi:hypothetical protein [Wolbachia endosymbiont of Pentidionis agamae]|uniref:hypothetical protein n=1 Tax=Wolbachia endosymbiont of Pentidionis agamae TaxID=3110435 RepID=UPI002FD348E8
MGAKISSIEKSDRKKDYQKKEIFEDFEERREFLINYTDLSKMHKAKNFELKTRMICWNKFLSLLPIKSDDIHFSPITELRATNSNHYTLPELISLFIELGDSYFESKKINSITNKCSLSNPSSKVSGIKMNEGIISTTTCTNNLIL